MLLLAGGTLNISGATIEGGPGRNDSNGGVAVKFDQAGSVTVEAGSSLTGGGAAYTGTGGSGLMMLHGGTITNAGAITGGTSQGWATGNANGGSAGGLGSGGADGYLPSVALQGFGGVGILGAGLSIINSGSIAGGSGHLGLANAIALSGDNNRLELHSGSIITGNVVVSGGGADNVFALGGTAASSFDASKLVDMVSPDVDDEYAGFTAFEKVGSSTWTLTGTSLFDGPISIDAGSLLINGAMTSATTTVATGALLGGDGQTGAVTIEAGGELSPGNSAGTITTGSLVIDAGGRLLIEFGNLIYDKVSVTGTVDLSGAELVLTALPGFTSKTGDSFIIIDNDGVDAVIGEFGGGDTVSLAGRSLKISYAGGTDNDVVLTDVTPAPPEPPAITLDQVKAAHVNVLGLPLPDAAAARVVSDIRSGSYSFDGYIGTLIDQADMSTLPAVIVNALLAGVTPTQSHLPELGAFATLQFDAYQETDSANPALGIYEALGLGFSETVKFQGDYGGLSDVQFLTEAYQDVFSRAASTIQIAHFEAQLSYFEGLYAGAGQSDQLADLHAKGAIIGQMIGHAVLDEPELHSFDDAAIAFLRAAGHGQAHYGEALALV